MEIDVRPAVAADRGDIDGILTTSWGAPRVAVSGHLYDLTGLPTIVATMQGTIVGVLTYHTQGESIEVMSIDAVLPRRGIGTLLLDAAADAGRAQGARRLILVTTNDNIDALRFYQRRGLRILEVRPNAVAASRAVKPSIPQVGEYGIPIRDEIVLGRSLDAEGAGREPDGQAPGATGPATTAGRDSVTS